MDVIYFVALVCFISACSLLVFCRKAFQSASLSGIDAGTASKGVGHFTNLVSTVTARRTLRLKVVSFINSIRRARMGTQPQQFTWFTCKGQQIRLPVRNRGMLPPVEWKHRIHKMYSKKSGDLSLSAEKLHFTGKSMACDPYSSTTSPDLRAATCTIACGVSIQDDAKPFGGGEDAFFVSYNGQAMGVADGVGGVTHDSAASGAFARLLMSSCSSTFNHWVQMVLRVAAAKPKGDDASSEVNAQKTGTVGPSAGTSDCEQADLFPTLTPGSGASETDVPSTPSNLSGIEATTRQLRPSDVAAALICSAYKNTIRNGPDGSSTIIVGFLQPSVSQDSAPPKRQSSLTGPCGPTFQHPDVSVGRSTFGVANIGDSVCMVLRRDHSGEQRSVFKSEEQQHTFNCPHQLGKLGFRECDPPSGSSRYNVVVCRGDLIIFGTDGFFDNLWDSEVAEICEWFVSPRDAESIHEMTSQGLLQETDGDIRTTPPGVMASLLASAAYTRSHDIAIPTPWRQRLKAASASRPYILQGGKPDDITVVAAWVD